MTPILDSIQSTSAAMAIAASASSSESVSAFVSSSACRSQRAEGCCHGILDAYYLLRMISLLQWHGGCSTLQHVSMIDIRVK